MNIDQIDFPITKTQKVLVMGSQKPKATWMVLHGYGQLAQFFSRKFRSFAADYQFVIPEGLHRFYLNGHSGRVGSSWMTKEERLTDIADYCDYLNQVWEKLVLSQGTPTGALGFSQGVATVMRWVNQVKDSPDKLVAWGGTFPPDLEMTLDPKKYSETKFFSVFGDRDTIVPPKVGEAFLENVRNQNIEISQVPFSGAHDLDDGVFRQILEA